MKPIGSNVVRAINKNSIIECADNTGAKKLRVVNVKTYKGKKRRQPKAGIGDVVVCSVKKGKPEIRGETPLAVIVRQKKEWRRPDGRRIRFEDNAAVLVDKNYEPRGNDLKGAVAKESVMRFSSLGKIAKVVV